MGSSPTISEVRASIGNAIITSISACVVIYLLVGFAVFNNLSLDEIVETKNYSLAAAAKPALGDIGVWLTVAIAIMATTGEIAASIFAVSRMLAHANGNETCTSLPFWHARKYSKAHAGLHRCIGLNSHNIL